jgi:glycosyltransferase involved in cell wall biosynthesis
MRIGIDFYGFDHNYTGGVNTFALGLAKGLAKNIQQEDSLVIIVSENNKEYLSSILENLSVTFIVVSVSRWSIFINIIISMVAWLTGNFKIRFWIDKYFRKFTMNIIDQSVDVILVPTTLLNFYALKVPSVLCIHDIQQEYHPELFTFKERVLRWGPYRLSCWKADAIQASSKYIKDCLIEKFNFLESKKVFIAHEGVDLVNFSINAPTHKPVDLEILNENAFVFYPAQIWPHKNHLLLIEALSIFKRKMGYELPCVLTGYDYGQWSLVQDSIDKYQLDGISYLGRVSFASILWLYQNCIAVLALGLHESSSLPVREGAVFGKPLICSNIAPNIETQEFLHLKLFDKMNPSELADVFFELMGDSKVMFANGAENSEMVKQFDWNIISKIYIDVINDLFLQT